MLIHEKTIQYYIDRINSNEYFSLAGFSDAEWFCMIGIRVNEHTGLGQKITREHGKILEDVIWHRRNDKRFLFAIPKCLWDIPQLRKNKIDRWLMNRNIEIEGYERDMVTDDLAEAAGLHPFIECLNSLENIYNDLVLIGNRELKGLEDVLHLQHFIGTDSPNLHLEPGDIDNVVDEVLSYARPGVYLVSAGVSAAVIIDRLHDKIPNSFFIDCGSIWDAFAGIGGQRDWRKKLYKDPDKLEQWKKENLYGKSRYKPVQSEETSDIRANDGGKLQ